MKANEAIQVLRWALNRLDGYNYIIDGYGTVDPSAKLDAFSMAIDALERRIPKRPKKAEWPMERWGYQYECPTCCAGVGENEKLHHIVEPFCAVCGQSILWEDPEYDTETIH